MSIKLQILIIVVIILAMLYIVNHVRKKSIDFKYALLWLFVSPVNMLFFFGFCLSIVIIFTLSIALSNLTDKVKKMAQEIAIIRKDMYERYNGNNRENSGGN